MSRTFDDTNFLRRALIALAALFGFARPVSSTEKQAAGNSDLAAKLKSLGYFADLPPAEAASLENKVATEDTSAVLEHRLRLAMVDAENLAEGMIGDWLRQEDMAAIFVSRAAVVENIKDRFGDEGYDVQIGQKTYTVHSPKDLGDPNEYDPAGWGRSLFVAISIANDIVQTKSPQEQFYALHAGGNDGFVWLLTPEQADVISRLAVSALIDLPIKMRNESPYYGLPH